MAAKKNKLVCEICGSVFRSDRDYIEKDGEKIAICEDCEREWIIKHTHDIEAELFAGITFPELVGTKKQIKWATQLRKHFALDLLNMGVVPAAITKYISYGKRAATWIEYSKYGTFPMMKALEMIHGEQADDENP